jgi:hypothetical protein
VSFKENIFEINMSETKENERERVLASFKRVLAALTPQTVVSDDTFLEKIQSYLTCSGNVLLSVRISQYFKSTLNL